MIRPILICFARGSNGSRVQIGFPAPRWRILKVDSFASPRAQGHFRELLGMASAALPLQPEDFLRLARSQPNPGSMVEIAAIATPKSHTESATMSVREIEPITRFHTETLRTTDGHQ